MRVIPAAILASLLLSGIAVAQEQFTRWADPAGRMSFEHPTGWHVNQMQSQTEGALRMLVGAADFECQIWRLPRSQTVAQSPDQVRQRYGRALSASVWTELVAPLREFQDAPAASDIRVDTATVWPTQHAVVRSGEHAAQVTLQGRPGFELITLCQSFDTVDRSAAFERIASSVDATS
jgi:hypothetical protein